MATKVIGIVGGIGPESTVDYYRLLLARLRKRGGPLPDILINSIDVARLLELAAGDPGALADYLVQAVERLARGGAELGFMAANTPHLVFDAVHERSPIPLVSIVVAAREAAHARQLRAVGLLGTRFTMRGGFYQTVFGERDIAVVIPHGADEGFVHDKYVGELVPGHFLPETRAGLIAVMDRMRERDHIEGVVLGGTELPLLLRDLDYPVPLFDTTRLHVDAVVAAL